MTGPEFVILILHRKIHDISAKEITMVTEDMARAVHAAWMEARRADGWTYGQMRNDAMKQTPCLVPYDRLPADEKAYDYATAEAVIAKLKEMGYEIRKS